MHVDQIYELLEENKQQLDNISIKQIYCNIPDFKILYAEYLYACQVLIPLIQIRPDLFYHINLKKFLKQKIDKEYSDYSKNEKDFVLNKILARIYE